MKIEQLADKGLALYSYLLISESDRRAVVIDPEREVGRYIDLLAQYGAELVAIVETHPHADFVSGHAELQRRTGAPILCNPALMPRYAAQPFGEGHRLELAEFTLISMETPGHSPDSICVLLEAEGQPKALFTGDTLFIGDVGRPDLREAAGGLQAGREELAAHMYRSVQRLLTLPDRVEVYPAHGAGSLCGKALSTANRSTIGAERVSNPALQKMSEGEFVAMLTADLPFTPRYFASSVEVNRDGAADLETALQDIPLLPSPEHLPQGMLVIDARPTVQFKQGHLHRAINLQPGGKFETWLGSVVSPGEPFTLIAGDEATLRHLAHRAAYIGYESQIRGLLVAQDIPGQTEALTNLADFKLNPAAYTIVDIRNRGEQAQKPIFPSALSIPLPELRERLSEIPKTKPVMIHCAAGYRSAAGQSIVSAHLPGTPVYDLGEAINQF